MKKIFLTIALLLIVINLYSQDLIDPPKLFNKNDTSATHNIFTPLNNNKFHLGYNAGAPGVKLDYALYMNNILYYVPDNFRDLDTNANIFFNLDLAPLVIIGESMTLNPCITVDSTENFTPMVGDNKGSVFGFCNNLK
jgi:hypothetical protein